MDNQRFHYNNLKGGFSMSIALLNPFHLATRDSADAYNSVLYPAIYLIP